MSKYTDAYGDLPAYQQSRLGYLMELEKEIVRIVNNNFEDVKDIAGRFGVNMYENSYLFPFYQTYQEYGLKLAVPSVSIAQVDSVVNLPVAGLRLSERLYRDRNRLAARVTNEVATGVLLGKSYHEVATAINRHGKITYNNAVRIVRTESTRISNESSAEGRARLNEVGNQFGVATMKKWVTASDERVRASHASLEGKVVAENDVFKSSSGNTAPYPGAFGVAKEDIHCRCQAVAVVTLNGKTAKEINDEFWSQHGGFESYWEENKLNIARNYKW